MSDHQVTMKKSKQAALKENIELKMLLEKQKLHLKECKQNVHKLLENNLGLSQKQSDFFVSQLEEFKTGPKVKRNVKTKLNSQKQCPKPQNRQVLDTAKKSAAFEQACFVNQLMGSKQLLNQAKTNRRDNSKDKNDNLVTENYWNSVHGFLSKKSIQRSPSNNIDKNVYKELNDSKDTSGHKEIIPVTQKSKGFIGTIRGCFSSKNKPVKAAVVNNSEVLDNDLNDRVQTIIRLSEQLNAGFDIRFHPKVTKEWYTKKRLQEFIFKELCLKIEYQCLLATEEKNGSQTNDKLINRLCNILDIADRYMVQDY